MERTLIPLQPLFIKASCGQLQTCLFFFRGSSLIQPAQDGCVRETLTDGLDLIFTDIMGVLILAQRSGPDYSLQKLVYFFSILVRSFQFTIHGFFIRQNMHVFFF